MPERLADAIDELAQPNRPQQEEPQIQADPALDSPVYHPAALAARLGERGVGPGSGHGSI